MTDEIERVRRAESNRGRRPVDIQTLQENRRMLAALREIWNYGTVDDLKAAMREYGISEDSPQWAEALRVWAGEHEQT